MRHDGTEHGPFDKKFCINYINKYNLLFRRYALWMADSKHDTPRDIVNKYLQKSLQVLRQEDVDVRLSVYRDIAKFADAEYKQVKIQYAVEII